MPSRDPAKLVDLYKYRSRNGIIVCAETERAEYPVHPAFRPAWGCLSIVAVRNGREEYELVDTNRTLTVDDDVYLVLDGSTRYSYRLRSLGVARCLMVSFSVSLVDSVSRSFRLTNDIGDDSSRTGLDEEVVSAERLRSHDAWVSPELRAIERACRDGVNDPEWYSQQASVLLHRILGLRAGETKRLGSTALRASTRSELARRVALVTDRIHASYREPLDLKRLAQEAELSPHHLLRVFKAVHGVTPQEFLQRKRSSVALRLLDTTNLSASRVASLVGFRSRSSLYRWMRARSSSRASPGFAPPRTKAPLP